jgi:hypothetical protein
LREVFSQDPLERYFSQQRYQEGSNENPTAYQVPYNAARLVQQRSMYHDLKSMNVEVDQQDNRLHYASQTQQTPKETLTKTQTHNNTR